MISRIEILLKKVRRIFSRSEWAIRLLRLSKLHDSTGEPGLVMVQIDGLSQTQLNKALQKGNLPFLKNLLLQERYTLHSFYSGLSSNTPAVQGEIFYGVKGCIPAFYFVDRKMGRPVKMMDAAYVEDFEARLKEKYQPGLLSGGSSYSNIFTGGAKEAHFCWAQLGLGGVLHAANPLVFPFLILLYLDIFIRTFCLLIVEILIGVVECARGLLKGKSFFREFEFIGIRVLVCVFLRELIVAGVCMDIMRGLPIIHLNFLGYDEQSHCRGPSSRFAHWALQGIDDAIKRINHVIKESPYREYDLWVYSDHGQDKTTPYLIKYGLPPEEAIEKLFAKTPAANVPSRRAYPSRMNRAQLLKSRNKKEKLAPILPEPVNFTGQETMTTAMGPLGQIYVNRKLTSEELEFYARKLVDEVKIPLVITRGAEAQKFIAYTPQGAFKLPEQTAEIVGDDHPFLGEIKDDLITLCSHVDAGEFIIAGWCKGEEPISFPLEYGAHAGLSAEETRAFALLPMDAPLKPQEKTYLRPTDLREAAQRFMNKQTWEMCLSAYQEGIARPLRLMSYNVHGCMGMDGYISTERIARVIARHNPDIVALQELDVGRLRSKGIDQAERIARSLEMKHHFHSTYQWEEEQYGNAILSRYPMTMIKMGALPRFADKNRYEPRGAMWIALDFQGVKIQIINTHLSVWPQERSLQMNALLSQEWLAHQNCYGPVILCGDFNALPGSAVYRKACERLSDCQAILAGHRPYRTWFGKYPIGQIDHIFVTPEFQISSIAVPRTRLDKMASDHLPLIVEMSCVETPMDVKHTRKET